MNNPEPGVWKIVTCINDNNQFIQEAQTGISVYLTSPPDMGCFSLAANGTLTCYSVDAGLLLVRRGDSESTLFLHVLYLCVVFVTTFYFVFRFSKKLLDGLRKSSLIG